VKIVLISDIHMDMNKWEWNCLDNISSDINTVVVAGDINNNVMKTCQWLGELRQRFTTIIWVAGNHDNYNLGFHQTRLHDPKWPYPSCVPEIYDHYNRWSIANDIHFLNRSSITIDDVTFLGATGWHDFRAGEPYTTDSQIKAWYDCLNDTTIKWNSHTIQPDHLEPMNAGIKDWEYISRTVSNSIDENLVVVTHHIPHRKLLWHRPQDMIWTKLQGSFANTRMEGISDPKVKYWMYGHTHQRGMTTIGPTTYVCNAKGYRGENPNWEPIVLEV
jgi:predicted phosphodiesterase